MEQGLAFILHGFIEQGLAFILHGFIEQGLVFMPHGFIEQGLAFILHGFMFFFIAQGLQGLAYEPAKAGVIIKAILKSRLGIKIIILFICFLHIECRYPGHISDKVGYRTKTLRQT